MRFERRLLVICAKRTPLLVPRAGIFIRDSKRREKDSLVLLNPISVTLRSECHVESAELSQLQHETHHDVRRGAATPTLHQEEERAVLHGASSYSNKLTAFQSRIRIL